MHRQLGVRPQWRPSIPPAPVGPQSKHPHSLHQVEQRVNRVSVPGSSVPQSREARGYSQFQVEKPVALGWEEATFKGMCLLAGSSVRPGFLLEKSQLLAETKTIPGHSLAGERWKRGEAAGSASGSLPHPLVLPQKPPCFSAGGEGAPPDKASNTSHAEPSKREWVGEENAQIDGERHRIRPWQRENADGRGGSANLQLTRLLVPSPQTAGGSALVCLFSLTLSLSLTHTHTHTLLSTSATENQKSLPPVGSLTPVNGIKYLLHVLVC